MSTTKEFATSGPIELTPEEIKAVNGGLLPLIVYGGAIVFGAALGAMISIAQGLHDARTN